MTASQRQARLLAALVAILAGCSSPGRVEEAEQTLFVQAYLTPGIDPEVRLLQTVPAQRYYAGREEPVSAAEVLLRADGSTALLQEEAGTPGTYRVSRDLMPVEEGRTYHLQATAGDRQLRARTTVPLRAEVTRVEGDTITYQQLYSDLFGGLLHPGQFFWRRSPNAAGYIIIVEAEWVSSLQVTAEPLTADLDTLVARRDRLAGQVVADSLLALDRQIEGLTGFFARHISLTGPDGRTAQWLRDREQQDWDEIAGKDWTPGRAWRERRNELYWGRVIDYWIPADSLRSDYWWWGVRFTGDYRVTLQAADTNYFDYFATAFNGRSGADGDPGPVFHTEGGLGVFGSYAADSFSIFARRGD